jgi:hypothetical protein
MPAPKPPTQEQVEAIRKTVKHIDGVLYKLTQDGKWREIKARDVAGYTKIAVAGRSFLGHRVVWLLEHGEWPITHLDHINGIKHDNRPENLRLTTPLKNARAFQTRKENSSRFRGVNKVNGKWAASIGFHGKTRHLGVFETEKEAALAYNIMAVKLGYSEEAFNKDHNFVNEKV